nr:RHS repeat-associated core domain-containing protein [Hephaestia mangrovi]
MLTTTALGGAIVSAPAFGQAVLHRNLDANGVDLTRDDYVMNFKEGSIGSGDAELSLIRQDASSKFSQWDNYSFNLSPNGSATTVTVGQRGRFVDVFTSSGSGFVSSKNDGATLTGGGSSYVYTASDGTKIAYTAPAYSGYNSFCGHTAPNQFSCELVATSITEPNGATTTLSYAYYGYPGPPYGSQSTTTYSWRLSNVANSFGYKISFGYPFIGGGPGGGGNQTPPPDEWFQRVRASFYNTNVSTTPQATVNYSYPSTGTVDVTDTDDNVWEITSTSIKAPGESSPGVVIGGSASYVTSVTSGGVTTHYAYSTSGSTATMVVTDPAGNHTTIVSDLTISRPTKVTDAASHSTIYGYDSYGRLTSITYPEGNVKKFTYGERGNITETREISKTPGTPADIVTTAGFPTSCTNVACNEPTWTKDANLNQTDYTYDTTTGQLLTVTLPAAATGVPRRKTSYSYTSVGGVSLLSGMTTCATATTCAGTANEVKTSIGYDASGNATSQTVAAGDGSVSATTTATYTPMGDVATVDGPLSGTADTTYYRYDAARRAVGVISADPDGSGSLKQRAQKLTYNGLGQVTKAEVGTVTGTDDTAWNAFVSKQQLTTSYDSHHRKIRDAVTAGGTTYGVTDYSYDSYGRPDCTAVRMNPSAWGTVTAACTAQTAGSAGPDRITRNTVYDALNRVTSVTSAYGVSGTASTESTTYSINGKVASVTDGEGNKTTYIYDGFDRLSKTEYPSPTSAGTSSTTDYEQLGYDANGNVTERDLRGYASDSTQKIIYGYDHLNRLVSKNLPGSEPDVTYAYDLLDRPKSATQSGNALSFTYDALSRLRTETGPQGTLTSTWDAGGRRTELQWPDGFYVIYDYDVLGEMTKVRENGATSGAGVLATYTYDDLGNRTYVTNGNGTASAWTPDAMSRLATLVHNLGGSADDLTKTFTYNPASQIASAASSNDAYAWNGAVNVNRNYTTNGLNQYTAAGSTSLGYDARGNLTTSGSDSYTYSSENLMKTGPGSTSLTYDPLLRLYQVTKGSTTTRFAYDGLEMVGEYNASNALQKRYVYGPGTDDPIVQYTGTGTTSRTWLHADERGSVIALTDSSGNTTAINSYDEYGIPGSGNSGRFQYTGQAWLPEVGLYYYKARMYSPSLGRFMQTDPIGYADGLNWYNYVGGDPVNFVDPTGMLTCGYSAGGTVYDSSGKVAGSGRVIQCHLDPWDNISNSPEGGNSSPGGGAGGPNEVLVKATRLPQNANITPCESAWLANKFRNAGATDTSFLSKITFHNGTPALGTGNLFTDLAYGEDTTGAVTNLDDVYVKPDQFSHYTSAGNRDHYEEIFHSFQFNSLGKLGFYSIYGASSIGQVLSGGDDYYGNSLEAQAKSVARSLEAQYNKERPCG